MPSKNLIFKTITILIPFALIFIVEAVGHLVYYRTHNNTFLWQMDNGGEFKFTWMDSFGILWFKPNSTVRLRNYETYPADLNTDNYGLVHNGMDKRSISDAAVNIVFVGGSTVQGVGSSGNSSTIPAIVESCLREASPKKVDVFNMGFSGDNTFIEDLRIRTRALKFNPALVVSLDGRNDFHQLITEGNVFGHGHTGETNLDKLYNADSSLSSAAKMLDEYLHTRSIIYKTMVKLLKSTKIDNTKSAVSTSLERGKDTYLANLKASTAFLKAFNVRHIAFFQPTLQFKKTISDVEKEFVTGFSRRTDGTTNYSENLQTYYEIMKAERIDPTLSFFNISDLFSDKVETLYVDTVHYNDKGNKLIANEVCKVVLREHADLFEGKKSP